MAIAFRNKNKIQEIWNAILPNNIKRMYRFIPFCHWSVSISFKHFSGHLLKRGYTVVNRKANFITFKLRNILFDTFSYFLLEVTMLMLHNLSFSCLDFHIKFLPLTYYLFVFLQTQSTIIKLMNWPGSYEMTVLIFCNKT